MKYIGLHTFIYNIYIYIYIYIVRTCSNKRHVHTCVLPNSSTHTFNTANRYTRPHRCIQWHNNSTCAHFDHKQHVRTLWPQHHHHKHIQAAQTSYHGSLVHALAPFSPRQYSSNSRKRPASVTVVKSETSIVVVKMRISSWRRSGLCLYVCMSSTSVVSSLLHRWRTPACATCPQPCIACM